MLDYNNYSGIVKELKRLNSNLELLLSHHFGINRIKEKSPDTDSVDYTDEARDGLRENLVAMGRPDLADKV